MPIILFFKCTSWTFSGGMLCTRIAKNVALFAAIGKTRYHHLIFMARQPSCRLAVEGGAQGCCSLNPRQHAATAAPGAQFWQQVGTVAQKEERREEDKKQQSTVWLTRVYLLIILFVVFALFWAGAWIFMRWSYGRQTTNALCTGGGDWPRGRDINATNNGVPSNIVEGEGSWEHISADGGENTKNNNEPAGLKYFVFSCCFLCLPSYSFSL